MVLLILTFYISNDKLFQLGCSCSLKRVYITHNLPFSWWITVLIIKPITVLFWNTIQQSTSVLLKSLSVFLALSPVTPGWRWCFLKWPPPLFSSSQRSLFSCGQPAWDSNLLFFSCSFLVSNDTDYHFIIISRPETNRPNDNTRATAVWTSEYNICNRYHAGQKFCFLPCSGVNITVKNYCVWAGGTESLWFLEGLNPHSFLG